MNAVKLKSLRQLLNEVFLIPGWDFKLLVMCSNFGSGRRYNECKANYTKNFLPRVVVDQ